MARVVTVTANPLLNYCVYEPLRTGLATRPHRFRLSLEGKGVNVARVLTRLGHSVVTCGFAGGHSGAAFREELDRRSIVGALTPTAARLRVGFMAASPTPDGAPTTLLEDGFDVTPSECDRLVNDVAQQLAGADLAILSGSIPHVNAIGVYSRLVRLCSEAGVTCWADGYGQGMADALAADPLPALAKPDLREYRSLAGWERVEELHVTDGGRPADIRIGADRWTVVPPPVDEVNAIGSGDCYVGGLAHARLTGMTVEDQLRFAAAAGAANAARPDVAEIGMAEIEDLLSAVTVARA